MKVSSIARAAAAAVVAGALVLGGAGPTAASPAAARTASDLCAVDGATLTWGFKESFRSYISGTIANGEWTVADGASYSVPSFGFDNGTGGYDPETGGITLAFAGSITFTGHAGLLNTTVSDPRLQPVDATSATLVLDVSGTTQDGAAVDQAAVEFAAVDLAGAVGSRDGVVTVDSAPAVLTEAGAAAFGTYPAGEALDPITVAFAPGPDPATGADCALPAAIARPAATPEPAASDEPAASSGPAASDADDAVAASAVSWVRWGVLGLVLGAAVVAVVLLARRRSARRSDLRSDLRSDQRSDQRSARRDRMQP